MFIFIIVSIYIYPTYISPIFNKFDNLEDDVIKYICEKIVAMREQPFIDAVDNLKRAQELNNLQMIMDIQKNKAKYGTSSMDTHSQQGAQQQAIASLHKELYNHA